MTADGRGLVDVSRTIVVDRTASGTVYTNQTTQAGGSKAGKR